MTLLRCLAAALLLPVLVSCTSTGSQDSSEAGPGAVATETAAPELLNGSFDAAEHPLHGWEKGVHANPDSYRFEIRTGEECLSNPCVAIIQQGSEPWGGIFQMINLPGQKPGGVRFVAMFRGIDADSPTHLQALVKRPGRPDDIHEAKVDLLPVFAPVTLDVTLPEDASAVEIGVVHHGQGAVVVDDVSMSLLPGQP
ncbi:hypothetical protein [Pseudomarimonas salicorniae]|uniref:Uncharacterized protein n=1 Tax=Pseudomarimonas salicorniae TaxID=2933270 RepID=A0ABT0GJQ0_9GAMM|nr:hypothetical protein [Lysobacter sp. CAU 1642]MCK7594587.1 hypothetical protein [Lysobacter sp. CAU 1642]